VEDFGAIAQIAVREWHPAWFILCGLLCVVFWFLYKLTLAYVTLLEQVVAQQQESIALKRQLIGALRALHKSVRQSTARVLREIDE